MIKIKTKETEIMNENELFKIIGGNVRRYRMLYNANKGRMTQDNLAEKVDISTSVIGGLESDKMNQGISVFVLYKISKALNVSVDDLLKKNN